MLTRSLAAGRVPGASDNPQGAGLGSRVNATNTYLGFFRNCALLEQNKRCVALGRVYTTRSGIPKRDDNVINRQVYKLIFCIKSKYSAVTIIAATMDDAHGW